MSDAYSEFSEMCDEIEEALERGEIAPPINYRALYEHAQQEKAELVSALRYVLDEYGWTVGYDMAGMEEKICRECCSSEIRGCNDDCRTGKVRALIAKHRPDARKQTNDH